MRKVSYKRLWKLLIDKEINKTTLAQMSGISGSSVTRLAKNETVNLEILIKVCNALDCEIEDIMELV